MFKITIDNEEVITDKDFTIEEEMLNTPSVILNNVYPKEWETEKDYLNFYHPNEYSKCKIYDEEITPASEGSTVEGTDLSITYDDTKEFSLLSLKGETSQSTTTGKNLLANDLATRTENGITITKNTDGTYKVNGTATADISLAINNDFVAMSGTWRMLGCPAGGSASTYMLSAYVGYWGGGSPNIDTGNGTNITYTGNVKVRFYIKSGTTCNNLIFKPMLTTDTSITINNWERYTYGASPNPNFPQEVQTVSGRQQISISNGNITNNYELDLGKNMLSLTDNQTITSAGITAQVQHGWIILNGTATATSTIRFPIDATIVYADESYTLSANNTSTVSGSGIILSVGNTADTSTQVNFNSTGKRTFTKDSATTYNRLTISTASGTTYNNYIIKPQLEKGTKATEYSDYKTPIELCKIGNYQDYIFKNTPDSDYYDNTLEEGAWYLHKAIGKVVLNGSETWAYSGTSTANVYRMQYNGINTLCLKPDNADTLAQIVCDYYITKTANQTYVKNIGISMNILGNILIYDSNYTSSDTTAFKNWLSQHPTSVYYVSVAPETTIIEDTDLLNQLDAISLLNGINYITVSSPNLVAPLKIHYNFNEEVIDQELYFCGVVKNSGNISLNPREPHFQSLQVLSYKTFLSEGETLDFVIYEKTIREAIEQVVSAISDYGFIVGDINILNPDEIIGAYSTKDKSAYDVFQYIADITQSRWTTRMIDEDTIAIDFYDPTLMELGTTIDYTKEFFEENLIDNMFYSYGTNDYRNKQVMTSQQVYSNINQTQNIVANGYQTQFNTEQVIGKINSILVDNVSYSFATNTEKEMGVSADFYYSAGNNYIESASAISVGKVITIDYLPIVEGRQIITNAYEIDRVSNSTGVKGIVARYENRNDATTSTELQLIGQSYIKYKGTPEIILTVVSRKDLWNVGQRVPFNAPIDELATEYMVRKKAVNRITTIDTIFYTYELTSSFNSETAVNYFDNQRAKANGNIGENEFISRNIDVESQARIIFYDSSANVITTTGDNKLNCTLESPFVE